MSRRHDSGRSFTMSDDLYLHASDFQYTRFSFAVFYFNMVVQGTD